MTHSPFNWRALESVRRTAALPSIWRGQLNELYDTFRVSFLQRTPAVADSYPCPHGCGCAHEIVRHSPTDIVGVCRCESWGCDDLLLKPEDLIVWELNWQKLGRALCRAFGLQKKHAELHLNGISEVGSWSTNAVPVLLAIQETAAEFRQSVNTLVAHLRRPFILLTPTCRHLDVCAGEILTSVGAGWFALENCVRLTPQGLLEPMETPGELFSRFSGQPEPDINEDVGRRAFALIERLDSERPLKHPSVLTVFRLYCIDELSAAQIARHTQASKSTVLRRLEAIQTRIGVEPRALRRVSTHFDKIEEDMADSRAENIHRRSLIYDEEEERD